MGLNPVLIGVIVYLLLGVSLLVIFDLLTRRIRSKFVQATSETQHKLAVSGNYVNSKTAAILFLGATLLFWPMVFIGAITDKKEDSHGS